MELLGECIAFNLGGGTRSAFSSFLSPFLSVLLPLPSPGVKFSETVEQARCAELQGGEKVGLGEMTGQDAWEPAAIVGAASSEGLLLSQACFSCSGVGQSLKPGVL